ncbi:MAG: sodium:calcium antiporter [Candidatus Nanoarchaeia archaeon]|jgi:cation:H+ antiporter
MIIELGIMLASMIFLAIASDKAVDYAIKISKYLGITGLSAGFIILSVSTSLPELFVSIHSSLVKEIGLSLGNVLGSNIANVTIILGLAFFLSGRRFIKFNRRVFQGLLSFLFVASIIPLFILQTGNLSSIMGVILLILFIFFAVKTPKKIEGIQEMEKAKKSETTITVIKFIVSLIIVLFSSKLLVDNSIIIAELLGIPNSIIGATIIGFGTSLPELSTTIQAFRKKLYDVGIGNIIGSCITNLTLILGVSSLLSTVPINILSFSTLIFFTILSMIITWYFVSTDRKIDRKEAAILIIIYLIFLLQELGIIAFLFK